MQVRGFTVEKEENRKDSSAALSPCVPVCTHRPFSFAFQLTGIIQAMVDGQPSLQQVLEVG